MSLQLTSNKEIRKIIVKAEKQGWLVKKNSNKHILLFPPNVDDGFVTLSSSPSSDRNHKNMLQLLKRKGLIL